VGRKGSESLGSGDQPSQSVSLGSPRKQKQDAEPPPDGNLPSYCYKQFWGDDKGAKERCGVKTNLHTEDKRKGKFDGMVLKGESASSGYIGRS